MTQSVRVLLGLTPNDERLIEGTLYGSGRIEVVASAGSGPELLELARRSSADVALVSAELQTLEADGVARLRASGMKAVGVASGAEGERRLRGLGLDVIVDATLGAEAFIAALESEDEDVRDQAPTRSVERAAADEQSGSVVCVIGGGGAAGATELAASLAALCNRRWQTCLFELDGHGGLALRLGVDAHEGSLLGLARAVRAGEREVEALVSRWLVGGGDAWPAVMLAPPDPERTLDELAQPGLVNGLLAAVADSYPLVVADLGEELAAHRSHEQQLINREAMTLADAVVLVVGARPEQLRRGLAQLDLLLDEIAVPAQRLRLVVNGTGGPGSPPLAHLTTSVNRELAKRGLLVDAWLPWDERSLRAATRTGVPLALGRRSGSYAKALSRLVATLFVSTSPTVVARKHRLRAPALAGKAAGVLEEVSLPWRR